jgi:acyl-CoA synthetase (NDP forming)
VGGVILNVGDQAALAAAIANIRQATHADRVLVQPMMHGLGEVLIGYRVDADVGPLVMLAAGGILAEIHRDRSLRLAPVDIAEAKAMIGEVAAMKALAGYRGKPAGDLNALANALVALSQLAIVDGPAVAEAEVNPLIVRPKGEGVVAVDALVKLA